MSASAATREGFVDVAGVPTHVLTCGGWLDDCASVSELVLCFTGNPGLGGYYREFVSTLHTRLGGLVPVWLVSHAGHYAPQPQQSTTTLPPLNTHSACYDLRGQVSHKAAFIDKHVPLRARLHLLGHSIGCYVVLELLKQDSLLRERTVRAHLLFPTVERMAQSPNGRKLTRYLLPVSGALVSLSHVFTWLPHTLQRLLLRGFFLVQGRRGSSSTVLETTVSLIRPPVLARVFHLARDEMDKVVELDEGALHTLTDKLHFYYGTQDGWAPLHYCHQLKENFPQLWVDVCDKGIEHAFVLGSGGVMAELVAQWVAEDSVGSSKRDSA